MGKDTNTTPSDSYDPRPYPQTFDGIHELPWDDGLQRYCGHVSQGFIRNIGGSPENTAPGLIELLGINTGRRDGRYLDLSTTDMAEFFTALAELDSYKRGEQQPRFWSEFSPDEKQAALAKLEEMIQKAIPEADPVMLEAVHILGAELEN